jgi:hypothetical protein
MTCLLVKYSDNRISKNEFIFAATSTPALVREALIASGAGLVELWEISPVRFGDNELQNIAG